MSELLEPDQVDNELDRLSGWRRDGATIVLDQTHADFAAALARLNEIADLAEQADHHPDLMLHGWNGLQVRLSTHSAGGITEADIALARRIDALAG